MRESTEFMEREWEMKEEGGANKSYGEEQENVYPIFQNTNMHWIGYKLKW